MLVAQNRQRTIPDDNPYLLGIGGQTPSKKFDDNDLESLRSSHLAAIYGIKRGATGATPIVNLKILTHTDT